MSSLRLLDTTLFKRSTYILFLSFFFAILCKGQITSDPVIDSLENRVKLARTTGQGLADALLQLGNQQIRYDNFSIAIPILEEAFEVGQATKDSVSWVTALGSQGYAHNISGESKLAFQLFLKGASAADSLNMEVLQARYLFFLGEYFRLQKQFNSAIEYLEKAGRLYEKLSMKKEWCRTYLFPLAGVYGQFQTDEYDRKAVALYEQMLSEECIDFFNKTAQAKIYNNLGELYMYLEENKIAEEYILKALEQFRKDNIPTTTASALISLANLNRFQGNLKKAEAYIEEAFELTVNGEDLYILYDVAKYSGIIHRELGNYKKAVEDLSWANSIRDSVEILERVQVIAELELKYKTAQKEKTLANQALELELKNNRIQTMMGWGLFILTLLGGFFIWSRIKFKHKEKEAKNLEKLDQLKTRYFTNISHELRTPLSLIIDPLDRLKKINTNDEEIKLIQIASKNTQRMLQLVNQMLELSKLEAGKVSLKTRYRNINLPLKNILDSFKMEALQRNIELNFIGDQEAINLYYDLDKLEKIIFNLLSNAFKFTPDGGVISVRSTQQDKYIEIMVKDSGTGIPEDKLTYIFDRFYQVDDSETRSFDGTGIGLALVKELVELHHGQVHAKSIEGSGTSMILHFPLGRAHLKDIEILPEGKEIDGMKEFKKPIQIIGNSKSTIPNTTAPTTYIENGLDEIPTLLIIEDHADLRKYMVEQLKGTFKILEAENGLIGIEMAHEYIPDLIVSDIMMPGIDGYDLCQRLKKDERSSHIPIILLTAKATPEDKLKGLKHQADDYLTKPFNSQELEARITNLIEQRKLLKFKFSNNNLFTPKDVIVNSLDQKFMQNLMEVVETNLSNEKFGVEELSKAIGMSRSQLHRKLKALTSQPTSLFIRSVRLQRAYQLLEKSAGNASEIAYQVGFSNSNYFFKCFKEEFSVTPGQVLKGIKINEN